MHDFKDIVQQTNEYIFNALLSYQVNTYKPSSIAVASLLVVCEDLGFQNFHNGILELIEEQNLQFNMYEIS